MSINKFELNSIIEWFLSYCKIYKYPQKTILIYQNNKVNTIYYIIKGKVSVFIKNENGKEIILSYLNKGDFIGEMEFFEINSSKNACIKTRSYCEIAEISYKKFKNLININPKILIYLLYQIVKKLKFTSEKVINLAYLNATERIAKTLLILTKQPDAITHPDGMQIKITRQEIGQIVGCSRETVGRILKLFKNQNFVSTNGKNIIVYGTR